MSEKVWAVLQQREGKVHRMSWEAVTAAQRLAAARGGTAEAVLLGSRLTEMAQEVAQADLAAVRVAEHPSLEAYAPGTYVGVLAAAIREARPAHILLPHTYQTVEFAARLAHEVDAAYVPEAVAFEAADGEIVWQRPVLGGKLQARVGTRGSSIVVASLQSAAFSADEMGRGAGAPVEPLPVDAGALDPQREILGVEAAAGEKVDLSKAEVIVAVGRGIGGPDKLDIIRELAAALGAEIGASRPVIDNGWLERDRQIGSSGQTVAPKLYLATGISGAIQHLVGMKGSQVVVAVNKDRGAPIFNVAHYGIVGDLHELVPALTEAIREAKGGA